MKFDLLKVLYEVGGLLLVGYVFKMFVGVGLMWILVVVGLDM